MYIQHITHAIIFCLPSHTQCVSTKFEVGKNDLEGESLTRRLLKSPACKSLRGWVWDAIVPNQSILIKALLDIGRSRTMRKKDLSDSLIYWTSPFISFKSFLHMLNPRPSWVAHRPFRNMSWTSSGGRPSPGHVILHHIKKIKIMKTWVKCTIIFIANLISLKGCEGDCQIYGTKMLSNEEVKRRTKFCQTMKTQKNSKQDAAYSSLIMVNGSC